MISSNYYDVTTEDFGNPYEDIGIVINNIINDIKQRQSNTNYQEGGKPGAVIFIPSGDYHLHTQVLIDISYLKIMGSGHGFVSSSIRFNTSKKQQDQFHELWPGGSRILVEIDTQTNKNEKMGAAFYVKREGEPRISSVEFSDFCIDGLHFEDYGENASNPENSYQNGKTGIYIASAQDSFRINSMGFVYLEHGITIYNADALSIHDNFIAECGNCIELRGSGQASKITDNLLGAGYRGYSIFAENFGGLLIATNNVFPRGASTIYFSNVARSSITSNRFHAFYPGVIVLADNSSENLITCNHIYRTYEPWAPMQTIHSKNNDEYGVMRIDGSNNSIIANHFSEILNTQFINPEDSKPVIIRVLSGTANYVATNFTVAMKESPSEQETDEDSCFATQVGAILSKNTTETIDVITVQVDTTSENNIILDSGTKKQIVLDTKHNALRPTPSIEDSPHS